MRTNGPDPHRTLGIAPSATAAEVKRAYRALAKRHHPDAERGSVIRFLEIQAAYEALIGTAAPGTAGAPGRTGAAGGPASSGAARTSGAPRRGRRAAQPGPTGGASGRSGRAGASSGGAGTAAGRDRPPGTDGGRSVGRRRATLGSTSYDGADDVFEPDWHGASWYGPSSGTYWTINPKEYADPRKHGPEYQARGRRPAPGGRTEPAPGTPPTPSAEASSADAPTDAPRAAAPPRSAPPRAAPRAAAPPPPAPHPPAAPHPPPPAAPSASRRPASRAAVAARRTTGPGIPTRVALALLGWAAPGLAIAAIAGLPGGLTATLPLQVVGVALLAVWPRFAWAATGAGMALVFAAIPIVALVAALGGPFVPAGSAPEAAVVLAILAWLGGLIVVGSGRVAPYPWGGIG